MSVKGSINTAKKVLESEGAVYLPFATLA